ncbi:hypothetical protein BCR39DRAFT_538001 [Naematelia encephala]|uniref:Vacuolar membrane-associated protein IML1 n=1 Tax=Naematelia encephala TaxID=71784 RepID=A0A1Y2AXZ8_9TREE|nr:hypothetical protein BCR39DRAFT_538001 [Naematelia encephala]
MSNRLSPPRPTSTRTRSSTIIGTGPLPPGSSQPGPPAIDISASSLRNFTDSSTSVAAQALSTLHSAIPGSSRPRMKSAKTTAHERTPSWPVPNTSVAAVTSAPIFPTRRSSIDGDSDVDPLDMQRTIQLLLYTYKLSPTNTTNAGQSGPQPSPLPSASSLPATAPCRVLVNYASLPWSARPGDYFEIRRIRRPITRSEARAKGMGASPERNKAGGEAMKGVARGQGRDGYVFRLGDDHPEIPINQIQVPDSVALAFRFPHRLEIEVVKLSDHFLTQVDYVELRFSQYLGRADMWRLGMSLENSTVHVGEKITLAGGAVRAEIQGVWRGQHRYSSGIVTAKTKTIFRSKSAQVYLFIQLCQETWEFDEDGERYYEKVVHGFLPELFARWASKGASHLVTIIFFARVHYNAEEVDYLQKHDLGVGLIKDYAGRWCKDYFRVAIDFERRSDWNQALAEIKRTLEGCEREILMSFHLDRLKEEAGEEQKRILGSWSFAYEGNVLEAVNLALNPFDEHYIDRDLSRTGLSMTVITPGTGHFAVEKNLLRLTSERMVDHGIGLDLVCLTKMPLHSVPLFSYVSQRPKKVISEETTSGVKTKPATPDLLYFDAHLSSAIDVELADCYCIPKWVNSSFYSKTHDKPFRKDRFVPRCKMYEIQMLGILDHNLTTVTVPLLDIDDVPQARRFLTTEDRRGAREDFDTAVFGGTNEAPRTIVSAAGSRRDSLSFPASYQSARLLAKKASGDRDASPAPTSRLHGSSLGVTGLNSPRISRIAESSTIDSLELLRTEVRSASPAPSSLSLGRSARAASPSKSSEPSVGPSSGQSTPKVTPAKRLRASASKSSFVSRFGANWLFSGLGQRSQPSFPTAADTTVGRSDVSRSEKPESPNMLPQAAARPRAVPGASFIIDPGTPSPAKDKMVTQPLPIATNRGARRVASEEEVSRSHRSSHGVKLSKSPNEASWARVANFTRGKSHVTVNPCNPKFNSDASIGEGRRWQHVRPKASRESQHLVKWTSLSAPACLPLTTDFMPTPREIQDFYEVNAYDIACFPDQVSFLLRQDAATANLPLAVMREMASQRLTQNFQFIVLPHHHTLDFHEQSKPEPTRKVLLPGDPTENGLRVGGASEVLRDASGAIYLLWSNHIHRLAFDATKQSVTVQRFVRKQKHSMDPVRYSCLVWPSQMKGYQEAQAVFKYPNVEAKLNFNYLDMLIAGQVDQLTSSLRYWRTRYILIPSGRDPSSIQGIVPKGENFDPTEILITGASKVLQVLDRNQWRPPGEQAKPLKLLPTQFDPSACVLDEGLMEELERLLSGREKIEGGNALAGMTLQSVAEMMCKPNNGLIIYDRYWAYEVHHDAFTGEQFCEWLQNTFTDVTSPEEAFEWGRSLFEKGLIEHVLNSHGFFNYAHLYYRLRPAYDPNANKRKKPKSWFGKATSSPRDLIEKHAAMSTSPSATAPLGKLGEDPKKAAGEKKRKIQMSQSIIVDLDPGRKSDRAEVAVLHADVIHNARNAFHFELNWLGVTAGLLDELRAKCSAQAERYGLRFVEAPVEQIKDISLKSAYRAAIPIPLALAPPVIPDLHLRLHKHSTGQIANFFEYAILTQKFGFILDVEASSRYPETIEVEYSYRGKTTFEYSQFCHKSGLALVQCIGGVEGFLWSDNRLFIAAPTRGGGRSGGGGGGEMYPNAPVPMKMTKQEEARALRLEFEEFCQDQQKLKTFYDQVLTTLKEKEGLVGLEVLEQTEGV